MVEVKHESRYLGNNILLAYQVQAGVLCKLTSPKLQKLVGDI
jgi:hypothetical protein